MLPIIVSGVDKNLNDVCCIILMTYFNVEMFHAVYTKGIGQTSTLLES